jgi:hypothetical protein
LQGFETMKESPLLHCAVVPGAAAFLIVLLTACPAPCRPAPTDGYEWVKCDKGYALFQDGRQVGYTDGTTYWPLESGGHLGNPCQPPIAWPGVQNFGVDQGQLHRKPRILRNGIEISTDEALRLMSEGVPDDSARPRLTIIGPEAQRNQVLNDLSSHPHLTPFKGQFCVQAYDAADPIIQGVGFITNGRPTIYLQAPSGKVLHRQDCYEGAEKLATALRKADPRYNPATDPNLARPAWPGPDTSHIPYYLLGGIGLGLAVLGGRRQAT